MKDGGVRSANRHMIILVSYALSYFKWSNYSVMYMSLFPGE